MYISSDNLFLVIFIVANWLIIEYNYHVSSLRFSQYLSISCNFRGSDEEFSG